MEGELEAGIATKDGLTYMGNRVHENFTPREKTNRTKRFSCL